VLFAFALLLFFADESGESLDIALKRFVQLFAVVEQNAADKPNASQVINGGAIPGMLRRLDPHSVFFDAGQFEQLKELERSTRKGFGSIVSILPGRVIVLQTLPGTPSARSGLNPGDEIIAINGIRLDLLEPEQLIQLLTEARQHQIRIDVRRPGSARLLPLMLTPEDVESSSVDRAFLLQPGIGYVRASSFDVNTGKQIREAIESLGGSNLKGLVLDLRNNPGGVLQSAVDTVSLFLNPEQKIVSVRGRAVGGDEATVPKDAKPYQFPLSVLINGKSASASEIVAGAIEDQRRGRILGEQSFGKGLVQSVFPLSHCNVI
jgi:carboxyl-terminal processing protease